MGILSRLSKEKIDATKLRVSVVDDESHKVLVSLRSGRTTLTLILIGSIVFIVIITYCLVAFTPLKHAVPGYPTSKTRKMAIENAMLADSLKREIDLWAFQVENIQRIMKGELPLEQELDAAVSLPDSAVTKKNGKKSDSDSLLRDIVRAKEAEKENGGKRRGPKEISQMEGMLFFPPVKGVVVHHFSETSGCQYVEISALAGTVIYSVLDGTVLSADWSETMGYTMFVQHPNNIISVYRHCERLLKKAGEKVSAGSAICLVGSSGNSCTTPQLHFELWHDGELVDPEMYIKF